MDGENTDLVDENSTYGIVRHSRFVVQSSQISKPPSLPNLKEDTTMTNNTNTEKMTCAELIAMIRDAAESGALDAEDTEELREYTAQIMRESGRTPKASA